MSMTYCISFSTKVYKVINSSQVIGYGLIIHQNNHIRQLLINMVRRAIKT